MKMIELRRGNIDIEHEGEMYRLWGELASDVFLAWKSWIDGLTPGKQTVHISEEEQVRVMDMVIDYWSENDKCPICFIDDNLKELGKTYVEPERKKTLGKKIKDWFDGNK